MAITLDGTNGITTPDLAVDTNTLFVDAANNRVGVGTSSPSDLLNLSSSDPRIRLTNTGSGYCLVRTGGSDASLILDADAGNTGAGSDIIMRIDGTERMRINASGNITTPYQPAIYLDGNNNNTVNFTGGQQFLTSANYATVSTRGGMSWNGGTARVTVPTTGFYMLTFSMYEVVNIGRVQIRKNGAGYAGMPIVQSNGVGTAPMTVIVSMSAGDYIDIVADAFDLPQAFMGPAHTHFSLSLMG